MSRHVVTTNTFHEFLDKIRLEEYLAIDTETTGLNYYLGARVFSIIVSTINDDYYFNFNKEPDHIGQIAPKETILNELHYRELCELFEDPKKTIFMHNAKFDMHMLFSHVQRWSARIICTEAMARLVHNRLPSYSLANLGALIGFDKDDAVGKYIMKYKLYTLVDVGKKEPRKDKHFDLVPFSIMSQYGLTDGRVTIELGMYTLKRLEELNAQHIAEGLPELTQVVSNEISLTKVLFKMENRGILIDKEYCAEAYEYEKDQYLEAAAKFEAYTGVAFEDSAKCFKQVFLKLNLEPGRTPKGNPSYSEENLPDNPVTALILQYRKHYKRAGTYFRNYLDMADDNNAVHCNFRQAGTGPGRMSSSNPNLQNVPKRSEDKSKYPVRKCFIPRPGYFLAMIDWDQMEYRLLLDRAGEVGIIAKIISEGLCVHTATAEAMNTEREPAKTLNFMLLYGGGAQKLATALKIALKRAKDLKKKYFTTLRRVQALIKGLQAKGVHRGFIVNWFGRRLLLDEERPYTLPNHYIQGGCGDVCKKAMIAMDKYIEDKEIFMLLQVHDEVIFEVKYGEEHHLTPLKNIMETTYPHILLPLTAGIEYSKTDWFKKTNFKEGQYVEMD